MIHIGNHLFHLLNGLASELVILGRCHGCKLDFLVLHLETEALERKLHFLDSLIAHRLVHVLAHSTGACHAGRGDGCKLEGQRKLEMRLGDDLRVFGVKL